MDSNQFRIIVWKIFNDNLYAYTRVYKSLYVFKQVYLNCLAECHVSDITDIQLNNSYNIFVRLGLVRGLSLQYLNIDAENVKISIGVSTTLLSYNQRGCKNYQLVFNCCFRKTFNCTSNHFTPRQTIKKFYYLITQT